jgi:hypothetical protein
MADGLMKGLTDMSGCHIQPIQIGDHIIMADGSGIQFAAGPGSLMSPGAGVFIITEDGTGGSAWAGTGFPRATGGLPGSIGIGGMIISVGVR